MSNVTYTPEEVANILKISKFTVYEMIKRGDLSAYRIGRKFRIQNSDLEDYIRKSKGGYLAQPATTSSEQSPSNPQYAPVSSTAATSNEFPETPAHPHNTGRPSLQNESLVICGQDILLDILTRHLQKQFPHISFLRQYSGSLDGLIALYHGQANVVTTHLWDSHTNEYNLPYVRYLLPGYPASVVNIVYRMEGFYVAKGNPKKILTWSDLARPDIRFVNRERGSGARVLLDEQLRLADIPHQGVQGYADEEMSHMAVASRVARGEADVGLGIEKAAMQVSSLDFVPLHKERYDMVILMEDLVKPHFQALLSILNSDSFRNEVAGIGGYDISEMGKIMGEV